MAKKPRIQFKYTTREETIVVKKEVLTATFTISKAELDCYNRCSSLFVKTETACV
ncbi:hypothetical protein [Sinorhizobium phage phiM5]|nr:hypothetical protein [Sinorhizobium phage phiM5]